jgi:predicted nucleic acid-binding protein
MMRGAIVDTSVWIDFFRGALKGSTRNQLLRLIDAERVLITDVIKFELFVGTKSQQDFSRMRRYTSVLSCLSIPPAAVDDFIVFGAQLRKRGLLGTYTDTSIAYLAQKHGLSVMSFDKYFTKLAAAEIIDKA